MADAALPALLSVAAGFVACLGTRALIPLLRRAEARAAAEAAKPAAAPDGQRDEERKDES